MQSAALDSARPNGIGSRVSSEFEEEVVFVVVVVVVVVVVMIIVSWTDVADRS
jgi:hypothetical protein